jgi:hypothetical protein
MIPEIEYYKLASKDLKKLREMIYEMEMTKSQNTKNEQQKDLCITSEQLTEQWKKGELPDGEYWCLSICYDIDKLYCYQNSFWKYKTEDDYYGLPVEIKQVLAPVPSYDEWFKIKNLASLTSLLQEKNIECLHRENKLKELLEECKTPLEVYNEMFGNKEELLTKIDEVLRCGNIK